MKKFIFFVPLQQQITRLAIASYWVLFGLTGLFFWMYLSEGFSRLNNEFPYPVGCQYGWTYCSRETYIRASFLYAYIGFQNLLLSYVLYRLSKAKAVYLVIAIAILAVPPLLDWHFKECPAWHEECQIETKEYIKVLKQETENKK